MAALLASWQVGWRKQLLPMMVILTLSISLFVGVR